VIGTGHRIADWLEPALEDARDLEPAGALFEIARELHVREDRIELLLDGGAVNVEEGGGLLLVAAQDGE
jgi:hypothetical protein